MSHIEQARELSRKIPELKNLLEENNKLEKYEAYREKLASVTTFLAGLSDIADELRKRGGEVASFKKPVQGVLAGTRRVATAFHEDKSTFLAPEIASSFWNPLEAMPKKIRVELEKEWEKYVDAKIPASQADILETLSKVPGFAHQAATVRSMCSELRSLGATLPQSDSFQKLDVLTEQLNQAWSELDGEGLPPTVLDFLKKAHANGFSLADLDNDVLDWLKKQNLLGHYTIRGK